MQWNVGRMRVHSNGTLHAATSDLRIDLDPGSDSESSTWPDRERIWMFCQRKGSGAKRTNKEGSHGLKPSLK
jgi:hypothetical protein